MQNVVEFDDNDIRELLRGYDRITLGDFVTVLLHKGGTVSGTLVATVPTYLLKGENGKLFSIMHHSIVCTEMVKKATLRKRLRYIRLAREQHQKVVLLSAIVLGASRLEKGDDPPDRMVM